MLFMVTSRPKDIHTPMTRVRFRAAKCHKRI